MSGSELFERHRARLLDLLKTLAYEEREVVLASGLKSNFYIDCKQAVLSAEGHFLVGWLFAHLIAERAPEVEAVGGLTMGADPLASALREADEEIGLDAAHVEPLGYLDLYMTTLGYRIVPVVARVKPGFSLKLNTSEVDNAFEVPLAFLMDQANVQRHSRDWQGLTRHYYAITFGERYIWGVTAGILRNLHERIYR